MALKFIRKLCLLLLVGCAGCSTVSQLPTDDLLYIGMCTSVVPGTVGTPFQEKAIDKAEAALACAPNNAIFGSSRYRFPLPIGLWTYNAFLHHQKGVRGWLFRNFASKPVLVSGVNPTLRTSAATEVLRADGYFDAQVTYRVDTCRNPRKARLLYTLQPGRQWRLGEVSYLRFPEEMNRLIQLNGDEQLLRPGHPFSTELLLNERSRLMDLFRDRGYYFFRSDFITYEADTLQHPGEVQLHVQPQATLPPYVYRPWRMGRISLKVENSFGASSTDTLLTPRFQYVYSGKRPPVRTALLLPRLHFRTGQLYSLERQNQTQRELNRLGLFSSVSVEVETPGSKETSDTLDVAVTAVLDKPYEVSLEMNGTAKSNDQIGPGAVASLSRKNLFRLGETLAFQLNGSYEWQTNRASTESASVINSYEVGLGVTLSCPQLLWPGRLFVPYRRPVSTSARLYADWLNRAGYFRLLAFGGNWGYIFSSSARWSHTIVPFRLTFNTLEKTTQRFDSLLTANPAIALSFRNQYIPAFNYEVTFDNLSKPGQPKTVVNTSFTSAGNLTSLVYAAFGQPLDKVGKKLFATPFAQFLKASFQVRNLFPLFGKHYLATRFFVGVIYPYGNSVVPPYSEQFYVGGANDIRAFNVRSIGPGSYHTSGRYAYLDQTGDFKLEANVEYRFPLVSSLHGAFFVDAGNVWLLRNDPDRPGGQFRLRHIGREIALGTGFGLRYDLRVVVFRLDLGVPLHAPYATGRPTYYNIPHFLRGLCLHFAVGYPF